MVLALLAALAELGLYPLTEEPLDPLPNFEVSEIKTGVYIAST
jgi:hypothetical protein